MGLVHKLLQPSLGCDGDDDGLSEKGILEKKMREKFMQLYANLDDWKGTMTTYLRVGNCLNKIGLHEFSLTIYYIISLATLIASDVRVLNQTSLSVTLIVEPCSFISWFSLKSDAF